ncbi:hypothetical protein CF327_g7311 [Tilletia walkeri]|nr:hypothetical protein CF327_g7311 [Tilletia walkeri]
MAVISDRKQEPTYSTPAAPGEEDPLLPPRGPPPAYDGPSSSSSSVPTAAGPSSTSNPRAQQQQQRRAPLRTRKSIFSLFSTRDHPITSEDEEHEEEQDEQEINPNTYQGRHIIRTRRQADLAQRRHTRRQDQSDQFLDVAAASKDASIENAFTYIVRESEKVTAGSRAGEQSSEREQRRTIPTSRSGGGW